MLVAFGLKLIAFKLLFIKGFEKRKNKKEGKKTQPAPAPWIPLGLVIKRPQAQFLPSTAMAQAAAQQANCARASPLSSCLTAALAPHVSSPPFLLPQRS